MSFKLKNKKKKKKRKKEKRKKRSYFKNIYIFEKVSLGLLCGLKKRHLYC
jgi:hypothetical protein